MPRVTVNFQEQKLRPKGIGQCDRSRCVGLGGADDQTPIDVANALAHGECHPLKINIGPPQCETFVDSQPAEGGGRTNTR